MSPQFNGNLIEDVQEQIFIGVWFNQEMNWSTGICKVSSEVGNSAGCLYKISPLIPLSLKQMLNKVTAT